MINAKKLLMLGLCIFVFGFIVCANSAYGAYGADPLIISQATGEYPNDHNYIDIFPHDRGEGVYFKGPHTYDGIKIYYTVNGKDPVISTTPKVIVNPKFSKVIIKNPITGQPINQPSYTFEYDPTKPLDLYAYLPTSAFSHGASRYILKVIAQNINGEVSNIVTRRYTRYHPAHRQRA